MNFKLINDITEYQDLKNQLSVMKDNLHLFQEDEEFNLCYQLIKSALKFGCGIYTFKKITNH